MANKKSNVLPKFEIVIIIVFLACFLVWGMVKCRSNPLLEQATSPPPEVDTLIRSVTTKDSTELAVKKNPLDSIIASLKAQMDTSSRNTTVVYATRLFVTIDKLKLRNKPGLKSEVLGELSLFQEVDFMNEITDTTQVVNLGLGMADEPWVKIRTAKGTVGWVYGAGVNYYRKENEMAQ